MLWEMRRSRLCGMLERDDDDGVVVKEILDEDDF